MGSILFPLNHSFVCIPTLGLVAKISLKYFMVSSLTFMVTRCRFSSAGVIFKGPGGQEALPIVHRRGINSYKDLVFQFHLSQPNSYVCSFLISDIFSLSKMRSPPSLLFTISYCRGRSGRYAIEIISRNVVSISRSLFQRGLGRGHLSQC